MPPLILLWSPLDDYLAAMLSAVPAIRFGRIASKQDLAGMVAEADGMVMLGHFYTADIAALVREKATRLRWIQLTTAGYDGFSFHGVPDGVVVTNAGRSHSPMVAEHAVTLLCALTRRLHLLAERQILHAFDRQIPQPLATLEDATVVVLGYGGIGRETARRLKAFGARVIAVARSARADDLADAVVASPDLHAVLARADALVVTAALTEETRGMIDATALAAMKPGGLLVNIARGGLVDTRALMQALHSGHLAGAGLDVTDPEPLPPGHPLWTCPNVIITPHVAGIGSQAVRRRIAETVRGNLDRFLTGTPLTCQVLP
ncbi:D-2-hydroxyacid dehydrogenase [Rhodopila sp.]|jgi:phosphoglycerate dehydrogenase-like enzyme|uniref:D-2-hydroxyacid dehydrogenase n=1 Tax=Rhodopila sp. TaxID=2480087 RepID=UPI002B7491A9|nr:D-2-hydroxyacid dehydrogenase [Rhodopila sp.]HVZ08252.1 D-2-hydroxyacid dehydrogenase [Rhodopila sp.]